ncbi:MAG: hypothetical protein RSP_18190 [Rhodanobacter sp.]
MSIKCKPKKDRLLQVRLEQKHQREFEALMERRGETMSTFVRRMIVDALNADRAARKRSSRAAEKRLKEIIGNDRVNQAGGDFVPHPISWLAMSGTRATQERL